MYRGLIPPSRALAGLLGSFGSRLTSIERRGTWPGAVQFDSLSSPVSLVVDDAWEPVLTISLDPGRWTLYGVATVESLAPNAIQQIRMSGTDSTPSVSTALYAGFGPGQITLSVIGTVVSASPISVVLQASSASAADTDVIAASIIATPV